jgi:hypothetical protein
VRLPGIFKPPYGGASFYGQAYRWEQVLHYKFWAFCAVKAWINEVAGGAPINLGTVTKADAVHKVRRKALSGPKEHEEFHPYEHDHPLQKLFRRPNLRDVAFDLWAYHVLFKKLTGQAHWWVMRNDWNVPVELWVIPTHWMRLVTDSSGMADHYAVQSPWGHQVDVPFDQVVSFYDHSPLNRYEGFAVSQAIGEWIDCYEAKTRMQLAVFKNGGIPAFHVRLGESYTDPDEAFMSRFYAKWFARFQGEDNSGKPLITGPDVEMKAIEGHRPADALFAGIQAEEALRDMVLAAYGVNKGVLGIDPTTDTSAYAPQRAFARYQVNPELKYTGEVVQEFVVKPTEGCEDGVAFFDDRVANDIEFEERKLEWDIENGLRTRNEGRGERGLPPYPLGGDNPFVGDTEMPWVVDEGQPLQQSFGGFGGGRTPQLPGPTQGPEPGPEPELPLPEPEFVEHALNGSNGAVGGFLNGVARLRRSQTGVRARRR